MTKYKLKPCPFCGGMDIDISEAIDEHWMMICGDCHAAVQFLTREADGQSKKNAVKFWNRRSEEVGAS